MKSIRAFLATILLATTATTGSCAVGTSTAELLQQGLYAEEVEGDLDSAFKIYGRIVRNEAAPANHAAQALYRMAMVCVKTNDEPTARGLLAKLVAEYPNETEIVQKAKPFLDDLSDLDPAILMPASTLVYLEFGSPGAQIETVIRMLKGTPYENPLAAIGGNQNTGGNENANEKSPGDIVGALLNPSMLAEFKKIRSSAIGVTGVSLNDPPLIAVLAPGKSDALRGLILAGLGVAGTPGEPIEGLQTVHIKGPDNKVAVAVAHDERIIIAARPASQLEWVVRQYKGRNTDPTLASSNPSFTKLSKTDRQKNAFTLWANVDEVYGQLSKVFSDGKVPTEIHTANVFVDFGNIDELVLAESVHGNGLGYQLDLQFKEGHHCLVYDLIRTPNIGKAALQSVPPEAVALASFSLSPAGNSQAEQVRARIQNITGLDLGREIFGNIEQVTIFLMPVAALTETNALPPRVGVSITSRNPDQTRQILASVLGATDAVRSGPQQGTSGRYRIGSDGDKPLYCHVEQVNGTTLISLDRGVIDASVASIKNRKSVTESGTLHSAVSKLAPGASKLLLANAGGAIRVWGRKMSLPEVSEEQATQLKTLLEQLAQAADATTVEVRTDEAPRHFTLASSVTGIPPLNEFIGPVTQIARIVNQAKSESVARNARQQTPTLVFPATKAPVIDGQEDAVWSAAKRNKLDNVSSSFGSGENATPPSSPDDLSADFRTLWDEENLYVLVDVVDDKLVNDTDPDQSVTLPSGSQNIPWWYDDCVEVYLDADNAKPTEYGQRDAQFHFDWDRSNPTMGKANPASNINIRNQRSSAEGIEFAMVTTDRGYRTEIKFPWSTLGVKPSAGATIGLDIHVNDDDDGDKRDSKITWHDTSDQAWQNPQVFGNGVLGGLIGWWKFDETEGKKATDSSGGNHSGTLVGNATWTQGKLGGAVRLDGKSAFVRIADKSSFDMADQSTISCWVNFRAVNHEYAAIVTKGDGAWRLSTHQGQPKFHASVNDWQQCSFNSEIKVSPGEWHHVATVYNGNQLFIYVDGKLDIKGAWEGGIAKNGFEVLIGENAESRGRYFDGDIDDVRIYNRALSGDEIKALASPR